MDSEIFWFLTVTLVKGQGHPNWYQNVELSGPYHHAKFERNWCVNVLIEANAKGCFFFFFF